MHGEIVHGGGANLPVVGSNDRLPRKYQARADQGVAESAVEAIVTAAEIQAVSFVANVVLTQASMLHHQAASLSAQDPIAAEDFAGIVADFVNVARSYVRRMGQ